MSVRNTLENLASGVKFLGERINDHGTRISICINEIESVKKNVRKLERDLEKNLTKPCFDWRTYSHMQNAEHKYEFEIKALESKIDELENTICDMMIDNENDTVVRFVSLEKKVKELERGKILDLIQAGAIATIISGLVVLASSKRK